MAGRFWMTFDIWYRTLLFVSGLAVAGAAVSGLVPALQATGLLARLGAGALAGRTSLRLGATWTTLVIAQVAFSVGVLPLAAELAWGTLRTGAIGPGFAAEKYATARVALEGGRFVLDAPDVPDVSAAPRQAASEPEAARRQRAVLFGNRQRELARRLLADPGILGVAAALRPPGEEPWVFADIEGRDAPTEALNGRLPGFAARLNQVDASFFEIYQVPDPYRPRIRQGRPRGGARCGHCQPQLRRDHRPRRQRARTPFPVCRCDGRRVAARPGNRPLGTSWSASSAICPLRPTHGWRTIASPRVRSIPRTCLA